MTKPRVDLDAIVIASPCTVPWESMTGDARTRFCGQCRLHVYDFSQMTRREAEVLLERTDGNVCKRIWRRPDGRVITKDCVSVLDAVRRRLRWLRGAAAGLLALVGFGGLGGCGSTGVEATMPPKPASPPPAEPPSPEPGATVLTGR